MLVAVDRHIATYWFQGKCAKLKICDFYFEWPNNFGNRIVKMFYKTNNGVLSFHWILSFHKNESNWENWGFMWYVYICNNCAFYWYIHAGTSCEIFCKENYSEDYINNIKYLTIYIIISVAGAYDWLQCYHNSHTKYKTTSQVISYIFMTLQESFCEYLDTKIKVWLASTVSGWARFLSAEHPTGYFLDKLLSMTEDEHDYIRPISCNQ